MKKTIKITESQYNTLKQSINETFAKTPNSIKRLDEDVEDENTPKGHEGHWNREFENQPIPNRKLDGNELGENEHTERQQQQGIDDFKPVVGMIPREMKGNGYKGRIEHVGEDYFVLRSFRNNAKPVLIEPFQYGNFLDYHLEGQ